MEDHHKRAAVGFHFHPRVQRQQHHQRTDVKQQNTVHHLVYRLWNAFLRILRFCGSNPDKLKSAKGEHNHRQRQDQPVPAGGKKAVVTPQVINACMFPAVTGKQHPHAKTNHADNGQHFNQRKPEFRFAIQTYVDQVNRVDDHEECRGPNPGRDIGQPVLHVDPSRGQFRHANQHKHHPVVPAGQKSRERSPVFIGKMGKRSGNGFFHHHFAQLTHNQKSDDPGNAVTQ